QTRGRDRTGSKVAQVKPKATGIVDTIVGCDENSASLAAHRAFGGAEHVRWIRARSRRPHAGAKRDAHGGCNGPLRAPEPAIPTVGAHWNDALDVRHLERLQTDWSGDAWRAARNANGEPRARGAGRSNDLLANLGVLHVGRTVAHRAHDDVDRSR